MRETRTDDISCWAYQVCHLFLLSKSDALTGLTSSKPCKVRHNENQFLAKCTDYALNNKLTPFISMQNFHNAAYREEEREMMPTLQASAPFSHSTAIRRPSSSHDR